MSLEVGTKVSGKVSGITNFGAFVDLGDHKTGLVHISEVSQGFVKDIHDVLKVGDNVTVKVLKISDDGKIALSIKQASESDHHEQDAHHQDTHRSHTNNHNEYNKRPKHVSSVNTSIGRGNAHHEHHAEDFDDMMSDFLKQSESRLATLKKNTEGKRGGRGGRRS